MTSFPGRWDAEVKATGADLKNTVTQSVTKYKSTQKIHDQENLIMNLFYLDQDQHFSQHTEYIER